MVAKKSKRPKAPKKLLVDAAENSPMDKLHKAMKKIVSVPKSKIKDK